MGKSPKSRKTSKEFKYTEYSGFWQENIQKIEEIHKRLGRNIKDLEKSYSSFEDIYREVEEDLNIMSSIYSSYNCIEGIDYILKLSSLVRGYRKRYTREGIDFRVIEFLMSKISKLRDTSFENFPLIEHLPDSYIRIIEEPGNAPPVHKRPYRWITFERNSSWFITQFNELMIAEKDDVEIISCPNPDTLIIEYQNESYHVRDMFTAVNKNNPYPEHHIIVDNGKRAYAASGIGKKIFSKKNIFKGMISPFKKLPAISISPGRLKIFGKNHIVLN